MPPRSHRASSAPVVPSSNRQSDRPHIEAGELCVGCIVWLPPKDLANGSIRCNRASCCGRELDDDGYEHPVVVLSIKQREGSHMLGDLICTVACVTTFGDTSLSKYRKKRLRTPHFQLSIPICDPKNETIEEGPTEVVEKLYVENGALRKQSYVKIQHTYEVPSSTLCTYSFGRRRDRAYNLRLTQLSYNLLMEKLGVSAEQYVATGQMSSTRESRLSALARPLGRTSRTRTEPVMPARHSYIPPYYNPYPSSYGTVLSPPASYPSRVQPPGYSSGYRLPYDSSSNDNNDSNDVISTIVTVAGCIGLGWILWKTFW